MRDRYLIIGLGNPGRKYDKNRHNLGFMVADALAKVFDCQFVKKKNSALLAETLFVNKDLIIAKPQTFMNRSGESVAQLVAYYQIDLNHLLVIMDDADLPFGTVRIRAQGSAGGHNGLKSIIAHLHAQNFARIRMGMGRPSQANEMIDYVLSDFSKKELIEIKILLPITVSAVKSFISHGIEKTMTEFNNLGNLQVS